MMHGASGRAHDAWTVIVAHAVFLLRGAEALTHALLVRLVQAQPIWLPPGGPRLGQDRGIALRPELLRCKNKGNRAPK